MAVEASIVVVFGDDADTSGLVVVELDPTDDLNLNSDGEVKSTFNATVSPVDTPALIIHHSDSLTITEVVSTAGNISGPYNAGSQTREIDFSFPSIDDTSSIGYADTSLSSYSFYGNEAVLAVSGNDLIATGGSSPCVGIANVNVNFQAKYILTPPLVVLDEDETYPITIYVYVN